MACEDKCCPPHNFNSVVDPTVNDCNTSVVAGYSGGYCPGSYWYNSDTGVLWIGANDMACGSALWINLNPPPTVHVKAFKNVVQNLPTAPANTVISFGIEEYDPDNAWNGTTFTAVYDGYHIVSAHVFIGTIPDGALINNSFNLDLRKNGAIVSRLDDVTIKDNTNREFEGLSGSRTVHLTAGETVDIVVNHDVGVDVPTNGAFGNLYHGEITIDQLA